MDAYGGIFEFTSPQQDGDDTKYTAPPGRNTIFKKLANGTYDDRGNVLTSTNSLYSTS